MNSRRTFLTSISASGAAIFAFFAGRTASSQGAGVPTAGYVRPGGTGTWQPNNKHTNRGATPQTVHARIEATEPGQAGSIEGIIFEPGSTFTPAAASVFWSGDHKIPHASLCMRVPAGASFQIKTVGDVPEANVHIPVYQESTA